MTTAADDVSGGDRPDGERPSDDRPSLFPWPPLLLAGCIALALAVDRWIIPLPVPFAEMSIVKAGGWLFLAQGLGLLTSAFVLFQRHKTSIRPDRSARVLLTTGPFAFSRNPIYLGEAVTLLGSALVLNRLSLVLVVPLFIGLVTRLAIRGEEAHLDRRFGEAYALYCNQVRRWL